MSPDPEEMYIKKVLPEKLELNLKYIKEMSVKTDIKLILHTIEKVFIGSDEMNFNKRMMVLGIIDISVVTAAVILSYFILFDFGTGSRFLTTLPYVIVIHALILPALFHVNRIYRRIWRCAGMRDFLILARAIAVSEAIFCLMSVIANLVAPDFKIPGSVGLLTAIFTFIGVGSSRIISGIYRESLLKIKPLTDGYPTLIIGAGSAGVLVARELRNLSYNQSCPVAFVDDDKAKWNLEVEGLPVIGGRERIPEIVDAYKVKNIVIAMPSVSPREIAKIIDVCKHIAAQIKTLPRLSDLISQKFSINMIRKVSVEDLLGREPVSVDLKGIADYVKDKVVLVTGAGGSIGSELCRQISDFTPKQLLLLGHGENSIFEIEMELRNKFPNQRILPIIADIQNRQRIQSDDCWVARKGSAKTVPDKPVIIAGSYNVNSFLGKGTDDKEAQKYLYSYDHGCSSINNYLIEKKKVSNLSSFTIRYNAGSGRKVAKIPHVEPVSIEVLVKSLKGKKIVSPVAWLKPVANFKS